MRKITILLFIVVCIFLWNKTKDEEIKIKECVSTGNTYMYCWEEIR
nr:MAG TPA: Protein of unknown function (DUF3139) [Caudoviricetes sp.]